MNPYRREEGITRWQRWLVDWLKGGSKDVVPIVESLGELLRLVYASIHIIFFDGLARGKVYASTTYVDDPKTELVWR